MVVRDPSHLYKVIDRKRLQGALPATLGLHTTLARSVAYVTELGWMSFFTIVSVNSHLMETSVSCSQLF